MRRRRIFLILACALVLASGCARRQAISQATPASGGTLAGIVTDRNGARIPGVDVVLFPNVPDLERLTVTDRNGSFRFDDVEEGVYQLAARMPGFEVARLEGIALEPGQTLRYDISLRITAPPPPPPPNVLRPIPSSPEFGFRVEPPPPLPPPATGPFPL
jgi:hypothetical protein